MSYTKYKKEYDYSYTLGAFPTIELIKNKKEYIEKVYIHSSFKNEEVISFIKNNLNKELIEFNDKIFNKLSDKDNVFIIGIFKKYKMNLSSSLNHVLLENPSNMGNLGTMIRSSLGFEFKDIAIIMPGVDIFDPKVIRASMGSIFSCNIEYFIDLNDYKNKFNNHTIYSFMLQTDNLLQSYDFKKSLSTLAFGNEASGLSSSFKNENPIRIKHSSLIDSLNITNAMTIALYEFNKQINK